MSSRLPADLLGRTAEEGARLVALAYLDEIARAEHRLTDPLDTEALHDFRVGLRRLRSCLRAYRTPLKGSVSKKMRERLRNLTMATNTGRDSEVQLAWLRGQAGLLAAGETQGLAWLIGRLEGRKYEARGTVTNGVAGRFVKAAGRLRPHLEVVQFMVRTGPGRLRTSFAQATGDLVSSHVEQLRAKLQAVHSPAEVTEAHEARIAAKRLRYLLEPVARRLPRAKNLVGRLKQLQDLLGHLHDMQVLSAEIASSLEALRDANPPSGAIAGLLALQRIASEESARSFADFETHWSGGRAAGFLNRVNEVGRSVHSFVPRHTPPVAPLPKAPA